MAVTTLVLIATAFLPILGVQFAWVAPHWIAGLVLSAAVLYHLVRVRQRNNLASMIVGPGDARAASQYLRWSLRRPGAMRPRAGKYSPAQKAMHHAVTLCVLAAIGTGLVMMKKVDTPFWERDPYWLSGDTWGVVYVLHGLAALILIALIMLHVYFALRPEKSCYRRAMIWGWMTREEHARYHDPERWEAE